MNQTTVFFDLETGGVKDHHPDIQLAAIAVRGWRELESFEAKIQFDESLCDPEALEINAYDPHLWKDAAYPEPRVVMDFGLFLSRHAAIEKVSKRGRPYSVARVAGHNAARFDAPRLSRMFQRYDRFLPAEIYKPLDTLQLALWSLVHRGRREPRSHKLEDLCSHLGISTAGAHEALADVRMTIQLARVLLDGPPPPNGWDPIEAGA